MFEYFFEPLKVKPFVKVVCAYTRGGKSYFGTGTAIFAKKAKLLAKSEAIERYVASKVNNFGSNGFAAHSNVNEARRRARLELIERHILMETWGRKCIWLEENTYIVLALNKLLQFFEPNYIFRSFKVISNDVIVLFSILDDSNGGIIFDSTSDYGSEPSLRMHLKNFLNIIKVIETYEVAKLESDFNLPEHAAPIDHLKYYAIKKNKEKFYDQISDVGTGEYNCESFESIVVKIFESPEKALIIANAHHPNWLPMKWGAKSLRKHHLAPHPLS